jgi:hypothetical protein
MEYFSQTRLGRGLVKLAWVPLFLVCGCSTTSEFMADKAESSAPTGAVCQVVTTWHNEVGYSPDPTHGGTPTPGISGRVYLFGQKIDNPLTADGKVIVDLFDAEQAKAAGNAAVPLEEWRIDNETLKKLHRRDPIGWGYTLFLPWSTYRPDLTHVLLKVRYEPTKGTPLYAEAASVTITDPTTNAPATVMHHGEAPKVEQASFDRMGDR